jgi:hypothetical protein
MSNQALKKKLPALQPYHGFTRKKVVNLSFLAGQEDLELADEAGDKIILRLLL